MKHKIHYKIAAIFICVIAIILSGIYFYLNSNLSQFFLTKIRSDLKRNLSISKSYLETKHLDIVDTKGYNSFAHEIGEMLGLRVTIINTKGKVIGDSALNETQIEAMENHANRPEIIDAIAKGRGERFRYSTTIKKKMLYKAASLKLNNQISVIRIAMPLDDIDLLSSNIKTIIFISIIAAFIIAIIISLVMSSYISAPIKKMSWIAKSISLGNFSQNSNVRTGDELEELSWSINYMKEQIKQRIDEVTSNKSRLEAVLLSMFDGVMVVDKNGAIRLMNDTLKSILEINYDPYKKNFLEVVRNVDIKSIVDRVLSLDSGVQSKEITLFMPDEKNIIIHATPIIHGGVVDGAVLIFHDVTMIKRLESVRKEFVTNASHELRTPVASIKGYAETLLDGALADKENARDFVEIIASDANRLSSLIKDILDLSRIESNEMSLQKEQCDLESIIEKAINSVSNKKDDNKIKIELNIINELPQIYVDKERILQVIINLIDNAIKYNRDNGTVIITATPQEDTISVEIQDSGVGISEADQEHIFERFYRVDKARSREIGGTGLGLSIVKHILNAHKQTIKVKSKPGEGTTFTFTLPLQK